MGVSARSFSAVSLQPKTHYRPKCVLIRMKRELNVLLLLQGARNKAKSLDVETLRLNVTSSASTGLLRTQQRKLCRHGETGERTKGG